MNLCSFCRALHLARSLVFAARFARRSHLFLHGDFDGAEHLSQGFKNGVTEGADAERERPADALDLDQVALDTGHHRPDVTEGDQSEEDPPQDGQGYANQTREQPVTPVLCDGECGVTGLPDAIEAVNAVRFCNHVFEIYLKREKIT